MFDLNMFKGVFIAFYAPYTDKGDISIEKAIEEARFFKNCGVKGLYVNGSSGEGFLLSVEERKSIQEAVIREFKDDMTIIVHVGAASTRESIALAKHAEHCGAHALSAVPSVYYRLSEDSIHAHWTSIIDETPLPFIIYNIPQLTGYDLSLNLLKRMIQNPKVIGVKNSSMSCYQTQQFKRAGGENFIVFNGPDEQYLSGRMAGAEAGIGGTYGAMPELFLALEKSYIEGQLERAQKIQSFINECIEAFAATRNIYAGAKEILRLRGLDIGSVRLPFLPLSEQDKIEMKKRYELIEAFKAEWDIHK